jgi:hypothetical protein
MNKFYKLAKQKGFDRYSKFKGGTTLFRFGGESSYLGFSSIEIKRSKVHWFGFSNEEVDQLKALLFSSPTISNELILKIDVTALFDEESELDKFLSNLECACLISDCMESLSGESIPVFFSNLSQREFTQFEFNRLTYKVIKDTSMSKEKVSTAYENISFKTSQTD